MNFTLSRTILALVISYLAYQFYGVFSYQDPNANVNAPLPWPYFIARMIASTILRKLSDALLSPQNLVMSAYGDLYRSQVIMICAKLGVPESLESGPKTIQEIASVVGSKSPTSLSTLLQAAEATGYFKYDVGSAKWENNHLTNLLRFNHPSTLKNYLLYANDYLDMWIHAEESLKEGKNSFERLAGVPFWDYLRKNPEKDKLFSLAMTDLTNLEGYSFVEDYNWGQHKRVIELGGGFGHFASLIMRKYPNVDVLVLDRPPVVKQAIELQNEKYGDLAGRLSFTPGSIFEVNTFPVLREGDVVSMKNVIQDFNDDEAIQIFKNVRNAIGTKKIPFLVITRVVKDRMDKFPQYSLDLMMLMLSYDAKVRTKEDFVALFQSANFSIEKVLPTRSLASIVVAKSAY